MHEDKLARRPKRPAYEGFGGRAFNHPVRGDTNICLGQIATRAKSTTLKRGAPLRSSVGTTVAKFSEHRTQLPLIRSVADISRLRKATIPSGGMCYMAVPSLVH